MWVVLILIKVIFEVSWKGKLMLEDLHNLGDHFFPENSIVYLLNCDHFHSHAPLIHLPLLLFHHSENPQITSLQILITVFW